MGRKKSCTPELRQMIIYKYVKKENPRKASAGVQEVLAIK